MLCLATDILYITSLRESWSIVAGLTTLISLDLTNCQLRNATLVDKGHSELRVALVPTIGLFFRTLVVNAQRPSATVSSDTLSLDCVGL